ncbi:RHS repeat-associated core domain-containing protein [Lentisphaerota bacterium WC36G]|nr:RHS repeat-associated core domain-containing protein [Lentisphaerae bacterium WC36]
MALEKDGVAFNYIADGNKNITQLIDMSSGSIANRYDYSPFGQLIADVETVENPFKFSSEYAEKETGLIYYNYRYYNPVNGKWLSRDPIEEKGGDNLYSFVGNDTIKNIDSLGLKWSWDAPEGEPGKLHIDEEVQDYSFWLRQHSFAPGQPGLLYKYKSRVQFGGMATASSNSVSAVIRGRFRYANSFMRTFTGWKTYDVSTRIKLSFKCDSDTGQIRMTGSTDKGSAKNTSSGPLYVKVLMDTPTIDNQGEKEHTVTISLNLIGKVGGAITNADGVNIGNGDVGGVSNERSISHNAGAVWKVHRTFVLICSCKK